MDTHEPLQLLPRSQLFMVRLSVETLRDGQEQVRLQVKHILSGETRYFRQWSQLEAYLLAKLQAVDD